MTAFSRRAQRIWKCAARAAFFLSAMAAAAQDDPFAMDGHASIMAEESFGIVDGRVTVGVNYSSVGELSSLYAPPFVSSDFSLELRVFGLKVPCIQYRWYPNRIEEMGLVGGLELNAETVLPYDGRAFLWTLRIANKSDRRQEVPISIRVSGTLDSVQTWEFARPASATKLTASTAPRTMTLTGGGHAIVIAANKDSVTWDAAKQEATARIAVDAGSVDEISFAVSVGTLEDAPEAAERIAGDPDRARTAAGKAYETRVASIFAALPRFESDNSSLTRLYNRSLVHLLTNRWEVPEFLLHPYYGTGSVRGGCVCNYLWDFGENWEILPLYDPVATKEHIKQFLKIDLTKHFAFLPITGEGFGPWYPVNQEKIIGLVYFYTLLTGDTAFLNDDVNGKTILQHMIEHAMYGDSYDAPQRLIDYGPSNSHLELRRGIPYNHVMPDLNGRRYANYQRAAVLAEMGNVPEPRLRERAEALKPVLRGELWDDEKKWLAFKNDKGEKDLRYTVQMFKIIGSGVLSRDDELGLLGHVNEREFLGEFGFHSMSKLDVSYDQIDIDNGGGGICTCFTPQIMERMYRAGYAAQADDILRRILWWGERMPYWGDSLVANKIDYRRDTPLQCTFDGATAAQCIIFGVFGVQVDPEGAIHVRPHRPSIAQRMKLTGLKLRGKTLDIAIDGGVCRVTVDGVETTVACDVDSIVSR